MEAVAKQLGGVIKSIRVSNGLTQKDLAEKLSIAPTRVSDIENGRANITIKTIEEIFDALTENMGPLGDAKKLELSIKSKNFEIIIRKTL